MEKIQPMICILGFWAELFWHDFTTLLCNCFLYLLFQVFLSVFYSKSATYLCDGTTNIWLRPVQEDLSMTACLEHSASNL
jgi:hypothetical protein